MVAICRDWLLGVQLVPKSTIDRASSTLTENSMLGSIGAPSGTSVGLAAPFSWEVLSIISIAMPPMEQWTAPSSQVNA